MQRIVPTGCGSLDEQLNGGLLETTLTLLYGEAETGKTTLAMQCAVNCARMGYKTIFIDCDNTFSPIRMAQIAADDFDMVAPHVILMKPENFDQQANVIDRLDEYIGEKVGLIVVDTVTGLYREKFGDDKKNTFTLNRELNRQIACLAQIAKIRKVASLIISQVRSLVMEERETVQPVATRVLRFWADTTITLKPTTHSRIVKATVETRLERMPIKPVFLHIGEGGLGDYRG